MKNFTKYYSYNQLIEEHDILVMTQQEYLANKDRLDNPQQIVLVNREGSPKEPKIPKWFQSYKHENDTRFGKIEARLDQIETTLNGSQPPKWFLEYMKNFEQRINNRFDNIIKKNNLKE